MPVYNIIADEPELDRHLADLPVLNDDEVWYICLFGRHKYDRTFPNTKDSGQLARVVATDAADFKEKLRRMECPVGSFSRDGAVASQECLAVYATMNPRSLKRANKIMFLEMAQRTADGEMGYNPVSLANTSLHKAAGRKFYVDFDFDDQHPEVLLPEINRLLPEPGMFRLLRTRGGFHLLVVLDRVRHLKTQWHKQLSALPGCDVRGSDTLTPVPGCTQGGAVPRFVV